MALSGGLAAQTQLQRQTGQAITRDGLEVLQAGRQGADAVEAGGTENKAAQRIIIANDDIQSAIRLAGATFGQLAGIGGRAGQ
ncbi:hypothetical protein D9M68_950160 [compost metagenome]